MIKDVMVWLDGSIADEVRLAAAEDIARVFQGHIIGLFLNPLPSLVPAEGDPAGVVREAELMERAREVGDRMEAMLGRRLARLNHPVEIRRFDVFATMLRILRRARRARPTHSSPYARTARWTPIGWSRAFCSDPAGMSFWFQKRNATAPISIASSSPGTAAGKPPARWPKPCRICTRPRR